MPGGGLQCLGRRDADPLDEAVAAAPSSFAYSAACRAISATIAAWLGSFGTVNLNVNAAGVI